MIDLICEILEAIAYWGKWEWIIAGVLVLILIVVWVACRIFWPGIFQGE